MKDSMEQLKTENDQKNEKIKLLEGEIRKEKRKRELVEFVNKNEIKILNSKMNEANVLMDKKIGDLIKANNSNLVEFVEIKNKWSEISGRCCDNLCINSSKLIGNCIEGNGFVNIIDDENVKYIGVDEGFNRYVLIYAENLFNNPQNSLNYSLYYFEIKCKIEGEFNEGDKLVIIGVKNYSTNEYIFYDAHKSKICYTEKNKEFELSTSFNNNDIFGCGLVYPPTNKLNGFPYAFFTQNGEQIGKAILLDNFDSYQPNVDVVCCSIETNFGNDLKTKPFKYDISKHLVVKEFY
uniref:SPRY domain-containing protein n=1 Tax=Meloidogyne incognita TaxID=6306 RepID=A0A914M8A8_MELIC